MQPVQDIDVHMSCECSSSLCKGNGFGPPYGVVNVDMVSTPGDKHVYGARIEILRMAPFPSSSDEFLPSPYLIQARLSHCKQKMDVRCDKVCKGKPCPAGVTWKPSDMCRMWECDNKGQDVATSECPPSKEWAKSSNYCSIVNMMMTAPFEFICTTDPSNTQCSFRTSLLPHGQIALTCRAGTCAPPPPPSNTSTSSWCTDNQKECYFFLYTIIFGFPVGWVAMTLAVFMYSIQDVRNAERQLTLHDDQAIDLMNRHLELQDQRGEPRRSLLSTSTVNLNPTSLSFSQIDYGYIKPASKDHRQVLSQVTGSVQGEILAILGPSGSGKTSLIDIIAGRKTLGSFQGEVRMNGVVTTQQERRSRCGYVMQDDVLPGTSTVKVGSVLISILHRFSIY